MVFHVATEPLTIQQFLMLSDLPLLAIKILFFFLLLSLIQSHSLTPLSTSVSYFVFCTKCYVLNIIHIHITCSVTFISCSIHDHWIYHSCDIPENLLNFISIPFTPFHMFLHFPYLFFLFCLTSLPFHSSFNAFIHPTLLCYSIALRIKY